MSLAALILSLSVVWVGTGGPVYSRALRSHELGAVGRAEQLAGYHERAARAAGVRPEVLAVLVYFESSYRPSAVHAVTGAFGLGALHPRSRWAEGLRAACEASPASCEEASVQWAARALAHGIAHCGTEAKGVGFYRSGRCVAGPRARLVMRTAARFCDVPRLAIALQPAGGPDSQQSGDVWGGPPS